MDGALLIWCEREPERTTSLRAIGKKYGKKYGEKVREKSTGHPTFMKKTKKYGTPNFHETKVRENESEVIRDTQLSRSQLSRCHRTAH